jgi:serine/threonine-protein kinase HipA
MLSSKLVVKRTLSDGRKVRVGELAENRSGTFFQYDESYLNQHSQSLSPFALNPSGRLQKAPKEPHYGIHGVFADSLPDGWGLYLMDRVFRLNGKNPKLITALERLAYVGGRCFGALSYEPEISFNEAANKNIDLITLGKAAVREFEGTESHLIQHLMNTGGSGGARPKINATSLADGRYSTKSGAIGDKLIVKLTSEKFALQHAESLVEYSYMHMARRLDIEVADFKLVDAGDSRFWLQQKRFDCSEHGRYHMLSACGLIDASFREPSLDYVDLIKATRLLCNVGEAKKLVKRALFNYLTVNQDDHSKNFAFLANDEDNWRLAPFYDIVYSPSPYDEHMTSFNGNSTQPLQALELLAGQAGYSNAKPLKIILDEIYAETRHFKNEALNLGVSKQLATSIDKHMTEKWKAVKSA